MRTYDFAPLYRSTVGFDRLASIVDRAMTVDVNTNGYPPYNIEKTDENDYRISVAVAGFSDDELSIEMRDGQLVISAKKAELEDADEVTLFAPWHRLARVREAVPFGRPCACRGRKDRKRYFAC